MLTELEENARRHLASTASLQLDASGKGGLSGTLTLPVQLLWHEKDLGADLPAVLGVLLPLLPAPAAERLRPLLASKGSGIDTRYGESNWDISFDVADTCR